MATAVKFYQKDNDIVASVTLHDMDASVTSASITNALKQSDFKRCRIHQDGIATLVEACSHYLSQLREAEQEFKSKRFEQVVATQHDAQLEIICSEDNMFAKAHIITAYGGKNITAKKIVKAALEKKIAFGIDKDRIKVIAEQAAKASPGSKIEQVIAKGKPVKNGRDARIIYHVKSADERELKPQAVSKYRVDMRDLGTIESVKEGALLAEKQLIQPGKPGITVLGETIEPTDGEDFNFVAGEGAEILPDNPNKIFSTIAGLPKKIEGGIAVDKIFQIEDVDVSTGHIEFDGSVIINKDVHEGMRVISTGDIHVMGLVESAYLEAQGDIIVNNATIGRQVELKGAVEPEYSTKLIAKGSIKIGHGQYVALFAGKDILVEKQLLHSLVKGNVVTIGQGDKPQGKLIGGRLILGKSLTVGVLGAESGSRIDISLDRHIDWLINQQVLIDDKIEFHQLVILDVKTAIKYLSENLPPSSDKSVLLKDAVDSFEHHFATLKQLVRKRKSNLAKIENIPNYLSVTINQKLYPGIHVSCADARLKTDNETGPCRIEYRSKELQIKH